MTDAVLGVLLVFGAFIGVAILIAGSIIIADESEANGKDRP